jgi:streptogramin lyase
VEGTASGGSAGVAAPSRTGSAGSSGPQHRVGDTLAEIQLTGTPHGVVTGFGSLWVAVAQDTGGVLVRIDPATEKIITSIPVGSDPTGVAAAAGSIWVASYDDGTLTQVDPARNAILAAIPVGPEPDWLAVDAGMLWVGSSGATLTRVDPVAGRRVQSVTIGTKAVPWAVAAGKGSVWTVAKGRGLLRLDSATGRILASIPIPRSTGGDLLVTDEVVWVSDPSGTIYVVDPATNRVVQQFPSEAGALGMAMAGGHLWVTHGNSGLVTWRSPETGRTLGSAQLRGWVGGLVVTDDNSIWVQASDMSMVVRLAAR